MKKEQFNWQSFTHSICIDAPLPDVFYHLTTADGICRWFLGEAAYVTVKGKSLASTAMVEAGDRYQWAWLEKPLELSGTVLACNAADHVSFSFTPAFKVEFRLSLAEDGRTFLALHQSYTDAEHPDGEFDYINCCVCWVFFLTNLKSVVEHDTDLRETSIDDEGLVNR